MGVRQEINTLLIENKTVQVKWSLKTAVLQLIKLLESDFFKRAKLCKNVISEQLFCFSINCLLVSSKVLHTAQPMDCYYSLLYTTVEIWAAFSVSGVVLQMMQNRQMFPCFVQNRCYTFLLNVYAEDPGVFQQSQLPVSQRTSSWRVTSLFW